MRRTATILAVIALVAYAPMSFAGEACCINVPYPGLGPPEDPMCYEGIKIYDNDGRMIGCVGYERGNCIYCEAVILVKM